MSDRFTCNLAWFALCLLQQHGDKSDWKTHENHNEINSIRTQSDQANHCVVELIVSWNANLIFGRFSLLTPTANILFTSSLAISIVVPKKKKKKHEKHFRITDIDWLLLSPSITDCTCYRNEWCDYVANYCHHIKWNVFILHCCFLIRNA